MADSIGHQLLSEVLESARRVSAECLVLSLPQLGNFQFLRRLVDALEQGYLLQGKLILCIPTGVTMAQLWPTNLDHFDEENCCWLVNLGRRRLAIRPSDREYTNSFLIRVSE